MKEHPEFIKTRRNVSLGKLDAFGRECRRLAGLAERGIVDRIDAKDALIDCAAANSLPEIFGSEMIEGILANTMPIPERRGAAA